MTGLSRIYLII